MLGRVLGFTEGIPTFPSLLSHKALHTVGVGSGECLYTPPSVTSMFPQVFVTLGRGFCRPRQCPSPLFSGFAENLPAALIHGCLTGNSMHYSRPQRLPSSRTPGLIGYALTFPVPNPDKTHLQGASLPPGPAYVFLLLLFSVCDLSSQ